VVEEIADHALKGCIVSLGLAGLALHSAKSLST
jgi:hypothetical protein